MITPRTLNTLEQAFRHALQETWAGISAIDSRTLPETDLPGERRLLALTLSSYTFRIIVLFEFCIDADMKAFLAALFRNKERNFTERALADALSEYVNMVCGNANRLLASESLHTGMSTPFVLETTCKKHIQKIGPDQTLVFRVNAEDAVQFELVLCVCAAKGTTLDLALKPRAVEETFSGELELF
jgi:hypothetical protein